MRQRGEAQRAVCLGLGRNLFQLCGHPHPTSERRGCIPGPAPRPAPPLPPVRGFPARRVLPADPTSTTALAFLWMVLSVGLLDSPFKTVVDLPGSVTLPCPPVPCSQTPPESPVPSPLAGTYLCLPSFRPCRPPDSRITRLHRFTCVTARTSLGLRLTHVVTSMSPRLDSRWSGSFSLPGRELHPLEAPGLAWRTKVIADVGVQHVVAAARAVHAKGFQRLGRPPLRPEAIRRRPKVGFEDGLQHERRRHLRHSVSDCWNAEGPLSAIGLRDVSPPNRRRTIRACAQHRTQLTQHALDAILLDAGERLPIDARRAAVPFHMPPRFPEDVSPPDPIHQRVEASIRRSFGCDPESTLQLAHFDGGVASTGVVGTGAAGHALARPCVLDVTTAGALPSRRVLRRDDCRYYDPLGRPLRTSRFRHRLIRGAVPRPRAAQTGLSCSTSLRACVLRPLPRRDLLRDFRIRAQQAWPSPRHDRLGSRIVNLTRLQASRDVAARVLAFSVETFDTPLEPQDSHPALGVGYSALRRLPRRDLHPLEEGSVER